MTEITVAALQLAFTNDIDANIKAVSELVREAAGRGAQVVLPPELFEGEYFCRVEDEGLFANARPPHEHKAVLAMQHLAADLGIHIPTSFFEADGPHFYNSLAMIGPDGRIEGVYRKSHIPDGPGYEEKFYFRPGNTGFKVWNGPGAKIGVGVCWDQWYPEAARLMALAGAGRSGREGVRMGLWGAAQAIAFAAGGVLGTGAVDVARQFTTDAAFAYGLVFAVEAIVFLWAAAIAVGLGLPAGWFEQRLTGDPTVLFRIFHYPALPDNAMAFVRKEYDRFGLVGLFVGRFLPGFRAVVAPRICLVW